MGKLSSPRGRESEGTHLSRIVLAAILVVAVVAAIIVYFQIRTRPLVESPEKAMREVLISGIDDALDPGTLLAALEAEIPILRASTKSKTLRFGPEVIDRAVYLDKLQQLASEIRSGLRNEDLSNYLLKNFRTFEVYGGTNWGEVLVTGYFAPVIEGDTHRTERFTRPLYRVPEDMVKLDLSKIDDRFKSERPRRVRIEGDEVIPYYTRAEIDSGGALAGRGLEICWVDPIDAFFLQIQGSGSVILPNRKELKLVYAEKNGHPYVGIAQHIREKVAPRSPTFDVLTEYLHRISPAERDAILNLNPSYIFFATSEREAVTVSGVPATAGRTIATDHKFFPVGALALLQFGVDGPRSVKSRLVLNQDVGGAIKGPGRVDLFIGKGSEAGQIAGTLQHKARLYYLLPR